MTDNTDQFPSEQDQAAAADAAAAARMRRPYLRAGLLASTAAPPSPPPEESGEEDKDNPYAQFRADPAEDGVSLHERFRLNQQEAFYRGTVAGATRLSAMADAFRRQDEPEADPGTKKLRGMLAEQYPAVVADLAAYDNLQPWGTSLEGITALTGSFAGSLMSPESVLGAPAKGATWLARTARAAVQQGAIQGAVDPIVQWLNRGAGVQGDYDPTRTLAAAGMGSIIGGGLHVGHELLGSLQVTKLQRDLAKEDDAFASDLTRALTAKEPKPDEIPPMAPPAGETEHGGAAPGGEVPAAKAPLKTGIAHIDAILNDPDTAAAIATPKVNRTQDVPYTAGPDKEGNGLNIDRHFPVSFTIDGVTFDPAEPFAVHEFAERDAINKLIAGGMDQETAGKVAHWEIAKVAEGQWYADHGIDQAKAETAYQPYIEQIEHEKLAAGGGDVPPNLFTKPYPHDNVSAAAKEPAAWPKPTAEEVAKAHEILGGAAAEKAAAQYPPPKPGEKFLDYLERIGVSAADYPKAHDYTEAWNKAWNTWSEHQPEPTVTEKLPDVANLKWTKVGDQLGSNPGGTYEDTAGVRWYVKTPKTEEHARNEMLANLLYQLAGARVPDVRLVTADGKPAIASAIVEGHAKLQAVNDIAKAIATKGLRKDFAADAWLANHDVIGLDQDNILVPATGSANEPIRIDQGGALRFRAQGEPKTGFGPKVTEWDTMRDPAIAPQAAQVFGGMTKPQMLDSLERVLNVPEQAIRDAVELYGPLDKAERDKLADTLVARQDHLKEISNETALAPAPKQKGKVKGAPQPSSGGVHPVTAKLLANLPQELKEKAQALGFDTNAIWYHGTSATFEEFEIGKSQTENAVFTSDNPDTAQAFIKNKTTAGHVIPMFTRAKKIEVVPGPQSYSGSTFSERINAAAAEGKDAVHFEQVHDIGPTADQLALLKPNQLRSIWAEFNPAKKGSKKLAALEGEPGFQEAYRALVDEAQRLNAEHEAELAEAMKAKEPEAEFLAAHGERDEASARAAAKAAELREAVKARAAAPAPAPPTREVAPPEKIVGAAYLHGGRIYSGRNHVMALDDARNAGVPGEQVILGVEKGATKEGFVTSSGRFVDRREAAAIADAAEQWRMKLSPEAVEFLKKKGITYEALQPLPGKAVTRDLFIGTEEPFDPERLKQASAGRGNAIFLAEKEKVASEYGHNVARVQIEPKNPKTIDWPSRENIHPTTKDRGLEAWFDEPAMVAEIERARSEGHDALYIKGIVEQGAKYPWPHTQIAVLDPSIIRREAAAAPPVTPVPEKPMGAAGAEEAQAAIARRQKGGVLPMEQARPMTGTATATGLPTAVPTTGAAAPGTALATLPQEELGPAKQNAIKSLQQQAMDFAKAIGFPLRQGRIPPQMSTALGIFNPGTGAVRVREVPDFEVVAHEGGHAIEKKLGPDLTNLTNTFASELAPLVSNPAAYPVDQHVKEGFAEYIRRYIGNPAHAKQAAPGFSTAFRLFLDNHAPEVRDALDAAAQTYQAYLRAPSVDVVAAVVREMHDDPEGWRSVVKDIRDRGLPAAIGTIMQHAYTKVLDDKAPVARAVKDMARAIRDATGSLVDLKAADNPEVLLRLMGRSQQAAVRDMLDGTYGYHQTTTEGPALTDALRKAIGEPTIFGRWDEDKQAAFSAYLVARRAEYLWRRFEAGDLSNPPAAFAKGDAVTAMAEFEKAHPTFREAADMVHDYTRAQLKKARDAGLIEPELFDKLAVQEFYVPFMRDLSDRPLAAEPSPGGGGGAQGPGMAAVVKAMRGSARDIIDPIQSVMMQSFMLNRTIQHNDVIRSFVRLADQAKAAGATVGNYVEKIPANEARKYTFDLGDVLERKLLAKGVDKDEAKVTVAGVADLFGEDPLMGSFFRMEPAAPRGEPIVFYREGGQLKAARFMSGSEGHAIYETLAGAPKVVTDTYTDLIASTSALLRSGVITNPTFALSNYIRDQVAVGILRRGYIPIVSGLKGIGAELAQSEAAKLYAVGGGVAPGVGGAAIEHAIKADIDALAQKGYAVTRLGPTGHLLTTLPSRAEFGTGGERDLAKNFGDALKGLSELAGVTEAGTRNSVFADVYKQKKAQGLSDYEAMIEAAFQSTDLLDFSRHGSRTLWVRRFVPFLNAHMQGLDKAYRTMVQPVLDKARDNQVFASDPDALNNAIAAWIKAGGVGMALGAAYAAVMHDSEAYRDASPYLKGTHLVVPFGNKLLLVPKPFELSVGFTAGEYAFQRWANDDPRAAMGYLNAAWQALQPPNPIGDIPAVSTYFEQVTGKSNFTGNDIVPDRLQRLPAPQQYTDRTSSLAKEIGKVINYSPMKIDAAIGGMFGNWGNDVMKLSQAVDQDAPEHNWEDWVFFRRFIKDPTRTSDVTTRFWSYMAQSSGTYNQDVAGYANLMRLHDDAGAKQFLANLPARERAFVTMKEAADDRGKPAFNADDKRLHPLVRAYDAVTILNGLSRDLIDNNVTQWSDREPLKLNAGSRRDLLDNVRELKQMEMRNAFVIMKEPGYAGRALLDVGPVLAKIDKIAPSVAEEIATRYATNKVYTTQAVAKAYPTLEKALLRDGSEAELRDLALDAKAEGYEFGGERVRRPPPRRLEVAPQPSSP